MALLARLFSPRKTNKNEKLPTTSIPTIQDSSTYSYSLDKNHVRVLLFRECDWRGRKLLFDSTSVVKVPVDSKSPHPRHRSDSSEMTVEISNGFGYMYKKPHADTNNLGEAIFGSVAMTTRGPSLKVHTLKDPDRIMLTKIIQAPRSGIRRRQISDEKVLDDSQGSSVNSMGDYYNSGSFDSKPGSLDDSGYLLGCETSAASNSDWLSPHHCSCSSHCPLHPPTVSHNIDDGDQAHSSSSLQSGSSLSSLRRRWVRSVATTLDFIDASQSPHPPGKRTKLGVALIIPLMPSKKQEMEQFLLDRLPLMNNILTRLQHSTERAYCRRDVFAQSMLQASAHATQSVYELVCGSRLATPLWLTLTSDKANTRAKAELSNKLVCDLSHLLATTDTKHTNFFISTLLTAVLTYHLGWVQTVFRDAVPTRSDSMLNDLSRSHPYNPLWAQLSDLQGALGYPPKIAKTVVVGSSEILVQKLLSILSYFIRCGQVSQAGLERDVPANEESHLEYLLEHGQGKLSFDKDAIREFSKASSFGDTTATSTSTLTKSKTVLSMKTFSVVGCDLDNTNSLESGFESCNDFSGESFEEGTKVLKTLQGFSSKHEKHQSSSKLFETSFSQNEITDFKVGEENKIHNSMSDSSQQTLVTYLDTDHKSISKMESEKQFTSTHLLDIGNRIHSKSSLNNSKSRNNSFIKDNIVQPEITSEENKENKVVFVLGENEELINIKGQDKANFLDKLPVEIKNMTKFVPPTILIDQIDEDLSDLVGERCETENKTEFFGGDVSSRIVIVHPTPIELEKTLGSKLSRANQLHRCLSVPEEALSETDCVKRKRSNEVVQIVRRWLSDSVIDKISHKPVSGSANIECVSELRSTTPASVFRTSNRSLKDVSRCQDENAQQFVNTGGCEFPTVAVEDVVMHPCLPVGEYTKLPSQSWIEPVISTEVDVAASLFGSVTDTYSPELVLQGVNYLPPGWAVDLQRSLVLEAHAEEADRDLAEAVCIVANTDTWEVSVVSSHSLLVDQRGGGGVGVRAGMSQLVANMLETTQHLCSLSLPAQLCLSHVETKLTELCVRSQALAEVLLNSDFLDIASLTSVLDLDANDVPLLLSVASTHTPLVTRKYGLSFQ